MHKFSTCLLLAAISVFTACKSHTIKVLVYSTGNIQTDNTRKNISIGEGSGQREEDLEFKGGDPVTLNIQSPSGKFTLEAPENGLYIANLRNDTVIGSFQRLGTDFGDVTITTEVLKRKVDSVQKLLVGENVSAAQRNYFIVPGKIAKITLETNAKVFGPFAKIPGGFEAGSIPEVYKFYTARELREIVDNLNKMLEKLKKGH